MIDQFLTNLFGFYFDYGEFFFGICVGTVISSAIFGIVVMVILARRRV